MKTKCVEDMLDRINNRLDIAREKFSELEDIPIEGILPTLFFEFNVTLLWKPDKDIIRKETFKPISLNNIDAKYIQKIFKNQT